MSHHDVIVIGLGGMGSAAAYHLARRGRSVLGLDAFERGHARGSSHGRTRIIREAYAESPEYMPLIQRAYTLWRELEEATGRSLLTITGGVTVGPDGHPSVLGELASAHRAGLAVELLSAAKTRARFPGFHLPDDLVAVFQPRSGILSPEECVTAHLDLAAAHGADLRHGQPALAWEADDAGVRVTTNAGTFTADRLVVTPGPWAPSLLADLAIPLEVVRIVNVHFEPSQPALFTPDHCPIHIWHVPEGEYYGFPTLPGQGIKFGRHDVNDACTPDTIDRQVRASEIAALKAVLDRYMPGAADSVRSTLTCMYTNTPDHNFVIDHHPSHPRVVVGCGFSGHGFKFTCVVGEILADLALDGESSLPIDFLAADRFGAAAARAI